MYASRAKKIRNQSCVNVDTQGQSNMHQVNSCTTFCKHIFVDVACVSVVAD